MLKCECSQTWSKSQVISIILSLTKVRTSHIQAGLFFWRNKNIHSVRNRSTWHFLWQIYLLDHGTDQQQRARDQWGSGWVPQHDSVQKGKAAAIFSLLVFEREWALVTLLHQFTRQCAAWWQLQMAGHFLFSWWLGIVILHQYMKNMRRHAVLIFSLSIHDMV